MHHWTNEDIDFVQENYPKMTAQAVADKLGLTPTQVRTKFHYLKNDSEIEHRPIPQFDHSGNLRLNPSAPCPYCKGTTSLNYMRKWICHSCDYTWDLQGRPLGVLKGVGI